jgi:uncharacterized protein YhdP
MTRPALAVALLFTATLFGADITGRWTGQMGEGRDTAFQLKMDGNKVTGTMSGANGEPRPISKGELNGDNISLTVDSEWQGQPVKLQVKGKVAGTEMKVTISSEGSDWSTDVVLKKT